VTDLTLKKTTTSTFIKTGQRKRHLLLKINRNATLVGAYFSLEIFQSIKKPPKIKNQDSGIGIHVVLVL
jgi:hypothetical protein